MKILITGIAGFLGSHLADEMLSLGHEVVGIDNLIGGYEDNIPSNATFHNADLNDLSKITPLFEDCDIVYHTACTAYEGLSVFSPSLVVQSTLQASVNAMTASIQNNVKRFVHCSSMARYGNLGEKPYTEDMICKPQDPYGIAKLCSEDILRNLSEIHGIELVVAVPHNIVGPRQKYDDPFRNVASIMINLMLQNRQPIIYGDGKQTRCFSDVRDVISCLTDLAFSEKAVGNVYNVGPDEEVIDINQLFEIISNKLKFNREPIYMPGRPQEVKHAICSSDKIREHFNYQTQSSLEETIESLIDYIQTRGTKEFEYHLPVEIISDKTPKTWKEKIF